MRLEIEKTLMEKELISKEGDKDCVKSYLLNMMAWFHEQCTSNKLRYYVLGGTMLGAVRHKGFIPWDDDIDVGLPRRDYERLKKLPCFNNINNRYILETPESKARDYNYCFSKLYDTKTTLIENTRYHIKRGIYIDIFPLDGMGNTEEESHATFKIIDKKFKVILTRTTGLRKGRSLLKNMAVIGGRLIPSIIFNVKKAIIDINNSCSKKDFDHYDYGGNPFGAWREKEIMNRTIMGNPTLYQFENIEVFGAQDADGYLTHLYGDWKELPPIEKRVSHHDFIKLDLNRSYLDNN